MIEFDLSLLLYGLAVGLIAGAMGGVLAGLAGLGGGLVYVPLFYALMPGDNEAIGIHVFASLVAVVLTGFFSSRAHWRLGHIDKQAVKLLLPGLMIGAGFGLWTTLHLPEILVLLALAGLNAWIAFDYGRKAQRQAFSHRLLSVLSGPIGYISGALGIGGGTMLVPLLRRITELRYAVGTAALCGMGMALAAVLANILFESGWQLLLADHLPFLMAVWLGILIVLPLTSAWAARLHTHLAEQTLHLLLKTLFICLSAGLLIAAVLA